MFSRMQETIILMDVWWHGAVQAVLMEEMLLVVWAAKVRLHKRSEVMARRGKILARATRCINAHCARVHCAS